MSDTGLGVGFYGPAIAENTAHRQRLALMAQRLTGSSSGFGGGGGGGQLSAGTSGSAPAAAPTAAHAGGLDMQSLAAAFRSQDKPTALPADFDTNKFALSKPEAAGGMSSILDQIGGLFGSAKGPAAGG